jgi:hypothetical protein
LQDRVRKNRDLQNFARTCRKDWHKTDTQDGEMKILYATFSIALAIYMLGVAFLPPDHRWPYIGYSELAPAPASCEPYSGPPLTEASANYSGPRKTCSTGWVTAYIPSADFIKKYGINSPVKFCCHPSTPWVSCDADTHSSGLMICKPARRTFPLPAPNEQSYSPRSSAARLASSPAIPE